MRDPCRIGRICEKLRIIWTAQSAQRLGQLVVNLSHGSEALSATVWPPSRGDLWNIRDEEWESLLDKMIIDLESGAKYQDKNKEPLYLDKDRLVTRHQLYED